MMHVGGRTRVWLAVVGVLAALAVPANAAPKRGEIVLRGEAGAATVSLPAGLRLLVADGFVPQPSGRLRGFVVREATGALVLAAVSLDLPKFDRVAMFQRGQGYETGRVGGGRYRISLLGDDRTAKDIVIPVEGLSGRRVLDLRGGVFQAGISLVNVPGGGSSHRLGSLRLNSATGLIWAWAVERGAGVHRTQFCFVPKGVDCQPDAAVKVSTGATKLSGTHFSAPADRPPGEYDLVLHTNSAGVLGPIAMVGLTFI